MSAFGGKADIVSQLLAVPVSFLYNSETPVLDTLSAADQHFKFEQRGKRRLHERPNAYEIDRCHHW